MLTNNKRELFSAAERGRLEELKSLLRIPLVNASGTAKSTRFTILHLAAQGGHDSVIAWLIEAGHVQSTATKVNVWGKVKRVLQAPVDINAKTRYGETALFLASREGHDAVVKHLLDMNADVTPAETKSRKTALHVAAEKGHHKIVTMLLNTNDLRNKFRTTGPDSLYLASKSGHEEVVKLLLDAIGLANIDAKNISCKSLHAAAKEGHVEIAKLLIKANPSSVFKYQTHSTPLHCAAKAGHLSMVQVLVEAKADVNAQSSARDDSPLHHAVQSKNPEIVRLLIKAGANVNAKGLSKMTPLHYAAGTGMVRILEPLLERGAEVNSQTAQKSTPLYKAATEGHLDAVNLLLKNGADPTICSSDGLSPLATAIYECHLQVVAALLPGERDAVNEIKIISTIRGYRQRRDKIHDTIGKLEDKEAGRHILENLHQKELDLVQENPRY
jgi:ankyrin repeat protein